MAWEHLQEGVLEEFADAVKLGAPWVPSLDGFVVDDTVLERERSRSRYRNLGPVDKAEYIQAASENQKARRNDEQRVKNAQRMRLLRPEAKPRPVPVPNAERKRAERLDPVKLEIIRAQDRARKARRANARLA